MKKLGLYLIILIFSAYIAHAQTNKRALRGVWVATVTNIDWPAKQGLSSEEQKQEMIFLLDKVKDYNMNTIIFQIRPTADAFYKSSYEPYSHWLTGVQGEDPGYDPLQFTIDECHKRGLNIHVWLNPYRINNDTVAYNTYAKDHIINKHPDWVINYGKAKYFDPGLDGVREFTCKVVKDIVNNYDIDAIHMDDYFYPYKISGQEFPDSLTFVKYPRGFGNKEDWRRNNVNLIIKEINETIKSVKPWVEFGISPFAIWRNKTEDPRGSETKAMTNYDGLYADILLWQEKGWIDYVLPQLYFNIGYPIADYAILSDWWSKYNYGANVYAGLAPYRVSKKAKQKEWHSSQELIRQINRNMADPNIKGEIYFSAKSLFDKPEVNLEKRLVKKEYKSLSISPENNRIKRIEPENPLNVSLQTEDEHNIILKWQRGKNAKRFVIYKFKRNKPVNRDNPETIIAVTGLTEIVLPYKNKKDFKKYRYGITSLSPSHSESSIVFFD
ncbi:glycoside hydrolase family 10 protein [Dysgonomonas termitidis]|uniref:Glycoside hydrolase family 10 protein n=1 Tax=Dysgonomonas termitidis TaxID=1516126 RepID=A0ABV9L2R8_9BACT